MMRTTTFTLLAILVFAIFLRFLEIDHFLELVLPPPIEGAGTNEQRSIAWSTFLIFCTGVISAFLAAVGLLLLIATLRETANASRASLAASNAALEANKLSQKISRPWLDFEITVTGEYQEATWDRRHGKTSMTFVVTNFGRSPGLNARTTVRLFDTDSIDLDQIHLEMVEKCRTEKTRSQAMERSIFPQNTTELIGNWGVAIEESNIKDKSRQRDLMLFAGVFYRSVDGDACYVGKTYWLERSETSNDTKTQALRTSFNLRRVFNHEVHI